MTSPHSRGRIASRVSNLPSREASMGSCSTSSPVEEYAAKVARKSEMDIDNDIIPNSSWADQVDADKPFANVSHNGMSSHKDCTTSLAGPATQTPLHGNAIEHMPSALGSPVVIPYNENQPANPVLWDRDFSWVSIFGTKESFLQDATNIMASLKCAATYVRQTNLSKGDPNILPQLDLFGNAAWDFITAIYESNWDQLHIKNGISFRNKVAGQFNSGRKSLMDKTPLKPQRQPTGLAKASVLKIPPPIPPRLSPDALKKAREEKKKERSMGKAKPVNKSFAQVAGNAPKNLLKLREAFPKLPAKKILEMNNVRWGKTPNKPKIQITTKGPSRKNVLIPIDAPDRKNILNSANTHIGQINGLLRSYKSNMSIDCIREINAGIIVTTNNITNTSDLSLLEKYFKDLNDIESKDISPRLPQSKSFLKILRVPYFDSDSNPIKSMQVETILTKTHLFNDITLSSRPWVIRASKNSDMAVIWVNIWDSQNGTKAKTILNRSFNFDWHIATIRGTTMNLGVPQCHNCWKWGYTTFACRAHGSRCQKCSRPHKLEHHRDLAWCCKGNSKTNPPHLETKKGEPCLHSFKCINCKEDHLADNYKCLFWKHRFNRDWHSKKAQELREIRANSIHSGVSGRKL